MDTEFQINLQKYRQFSEYSTKKIIEKAFNYITIKRYNNDTADMFLYLWGLHFLKFYVKQQWCSLVLSIKKSVQKNRIQNLHSWISHCTRFRLKHKALKFRDHNFSKKQLLVSKSALPNTPLYRVSFETKPFEISVPNLPQKVILGTEFEKEILEFRISKPEYSFIPSFILSKALWSFGTKFAQNRYFREEN